MRGNINIATKFAAYPWRVLPSNMVAACKGSCRRLGMEQISIGQLHWSAANYAPLQVGWWVGVASGWASGWVRPNWGFARTVAPAPHLIDHKVPHSPFPLPPSPFPLLPLHFPLPPPPSLALPYRSWQCRRGWQTATTRGS